jgi:hypothetical protein
MNHMYQLVSMQEPVQGPAVKRDIVPPVTTIRERVVSALPVEVVVVQQK